MLAKKFGMKPSETSGKSVDELISFIVERQSQDSEQNQQDTTRPSSPKNEVIKAIFKASFLPQQKGEKREHCSLGHRLEKPILKKWIDIAVKQKLVHHVEGAYTAGLAAKKDKPFVKDSIDFLVTVQEHPADVEFSLWGFEAKGRVTNRTAANEEMNLHHLANPHISIKASEAYEHIHDPKERFQVLHHAYVYDLKKVVLCISDEDSELIRSTIIEFDDELKRAYGRTLETIKSIALEWFYEFE